MRWQCMLSTQQAAHMRPNAKCCTCHAQEPAFLVQQIVHLGGCVALQARVQQRASRQEQVRVFSSAAHACRAMAEPAIDLAPQARKQYLAHLSLKEEGDGGVQVPCGTEKGKAGDGRAGGT